MNTALTRIRGSLARYAEWLHLRWPAGTVEKLPVVAADGTTTMAGVRVVGDLTGIPLLKFAVDSGAKAARAVAEEIKAEGRTGEMLDLAIVGAGVSGIAAAIEAKRLGLRLAIFEATEAFSTVVNFPKGKLIYTYPTGMKPAGGFQVSAPVKEELVAEMERQRAAAGIEATPLRIERIERRGNEFSLHGASGEPVAARRVIVAIGRSGNFRKLDVPGENLPKVYNRLHDPKEFRGRDALVVGGGDSALETAIALATCGARVTLSYRGKEFSRPKPENVAKLEALERNPAAAVAVERPTSERVTTAASFHLRGDCPPGSVARAMETRVKEIADGRVVLADGGRKEKAIPNDVIFTMIGREAPLDFFRRSGIAISGEWKPATWIAFLAFFAFCWAMYLWKATGTNFSRWLQGAGFFPFRVQEWFGGLGGSVAAAAAAPSTVLGTLAISMREPGFYYSLAYCLCVVIFGFRRIARRRTPYVNAQTWTLMLVQVIPLFVLPYLVLPWMGHNGMFDAGFGKAFADAFFPVADYGQGREYWRAFGFILAWPLFIWNVFNAEPLWWWLALSFVQTFVIIPIIVWRWGKGAYCGWICSCGALAETLGDKHRQKMPHGPIWNRLNFVGQAVLALALLLLALRLASWLNPAGFGWVFSGPYYGLLSGWSVFGLSLNYYHLVDIFLAGVIGVGMYFWFSGRVWCRFACPLAALMHIYTRFSQFRIFADKPKCISCNVCTSVCHQGIDVMNFANKGLAMEDPQCVRCSACVQSCPTGVLSFGRLEPGQRVVLDRLAASPVRMMERAE